MTNNKGDILAVDDTPASLKLLTDTLMAEGYQLRSALSGELALDAAASEPPELVLLDIRMPGMDGFEVCRRLKARPETCEIPVIFISALSETVDKVLGFELGAVDYVTKPYQREELLARVGAHLELYRLRHRFERMVDERTAELRASEEKLAESKEELDRFFTLALDLLCIASTEGFFLRLNPEWERMLGYSLKDLMSRGYFDFVHPDDVVSTRAAMASLAAQENVCNFVNRYRCKDGSYRWIEWRSAATGGLLYASARDITERKMAEEEIAQLNRELQHRLEALEEATKELETFSYSVSHDLKVPLRAIDGFICILREEYGNLLAGEGKRYLEVVRKNTARMQRLIEGLLDFISLSRREMRMEEVDVGALAQEVFADLRAATPERDIRLCVGDLPAARCDRGMIHQALANLLDNAIKFTGQSAHASIEIGGDATDKEHIYFVRDNGIGFDMRYIDKLFGVFLRLHSPEEFEGPGVGLAIVKRIVGRHGGRVWAEGKEGEGATFHFALPRIEAIN
jgi:PAS domain S-box-containing protein